MSIPKIYNNIFSLKESDKYVGSYISRVDVSTILNVAEEDLKKLTFIQYNDNEYIYEKDLKKAWESCMIPHAPCHYCGNAKVSLDELILAAIIKQTFPNATISRQTPWGRTKRKRIDIEVNMDSRRFFIEFLGPGHFKQQYTNPIKNPFVRKKEIEDEFHCECYLWPYWIQRCSLNLKILTQKDHVSNGRGALWSSSGFFGQFVLEDSASIIEQLTLQFRAIPNGNYGYFYEGFSNDNFVKQEHPIISKILRGKASCKILVPKGAKDNEVFKWLPDKVYQMLLKKDIA